MRKFLLTTAVGIVGAILVVSTTALSSASATTATSDARSAKLLCGSGYKLISAPTPVVANNERQSHVATIYLASNGKQDCAVERTAGWLAKTPHVMEVYLCRYAGNDDDCGYSKAPNFVYRQGIRTSQIGPVYIADTKNNCMTATGQASPNTKIKDATAIGWASAHCNY